MHRTEIVGVKWVWRRGEIAGGIRMRTGRAGQRVRGAFHARPMRPFRFLGWILLSAGLFALGAGCTPAITRNTVLAEVDGAPITAGDLEYAVSVAHRKESLSKTTKVDFSEFMGKLIDDRLFINEALQMEMDKSPEIANAVASYEVRESVVRLHNEEVLSKVAVSEEDVITYYEKNYVRLALIETETETDAKAAREKLLAGQDFGAVAQEYAKLASKKESGEVTMPKKGVSAQIAKQVESLKPNELTEPINIEKRWYIIKSFPLDGRTDPWLKERWGEIERAVRSQKQTEREDAYLKELRGKSKIWVDQALLDEIPVKGSAEEIERWKRDKRPVARVDHWELTAGEFMTRAAEGGTLSQASKSKQANLDNWIAVKVVDVEAMRRDYVKQPELAAEIESYRNYLLKNGFIRTVVIPKIVVNDAALQEYYKGHLGLYTKQGRFRLQHITVEKLEEALKVEENLKQGADFAWLAKITAAKSDSDDEGGSDLGWVPRAQLPVPLRDIIDTMKPGDVSPPFQIDGGYRIVRLMARTPDEVEPFENVRSEVSKAVFAEQYEELTRKYADELRKTADVRIYEDRVKAFEIKIRGELP